MLFSIIALTIIWIILRESVTISTALIGIVISTGCVFLYNRIMPLPGVKSVKTFRLLLYLVYLFGQVFLGGFLVIKRIVVGADVDIVPIKTKISNNFLQTILSNSITLIPGSISLDLNDDTITVVRFKEKSDDSRDTEKAGESLKGKIERVLIKAER